MILQAGSGEPPRLQPSGGWHLSLSHSRGAALVAMVRQPLLLTHGRGQAVPYRITLWSDHR